MSQPNGGTFDIVILGAGSGGYAAALRAAELDLSVALVDKAELGGTCLHRGCIPTKALLHAAEIADQTRESEQFGIKADLVGVDMAGVNAYKDAVVGRLYKGLQGLLKNDKITVVPGHGKLVAKDTVEVNGQRYTGRNIILASGSYSRSIPGLEVDGKRVITSEHALKLDRVPSSVIVLGGGVIGVEFASVWKSFGAEVTVLEALPRLVAAEDEDISKQLERAFRKRKINFKVGKRFEKAEHTENGVRATIAGGETVEAEILMVAVGRGPVTDGLGYAEQGITLDRGFVITNERLHTGVGNIYAVGDIVPGLQLAHRGFAQGIFVAEEIAGQKPAVIDEPGIPRVTYSDPQVASVGYTEAGAKEKFGADKISSYNYNLGGNGKSQILKTQGFVKVIRQIDGPVVGVHMVGDRMGELIGEAQLIYNWEAFPEDVAQLIHAHPTQTEAVGEAFLALAGKPLHAHA